jgi:hypothetical protein
MTCCLYTLRKKKRRKTTRRVYTLLFDDLFRSLFFCKAITRRPNRDVHTYENFPLAGTIASDWAAELPSIKREKGPLGPALRRLYSSESQFDNFTTRSAQQLCCSAFFAIGSSQQASIKKERRTDVMSASSRSTFSSSTTSFVFCSQPIAASFPQLTSKSSGPLVSFIHHSPIWRNPMNFIRVSS